MEHGRPGLRSIGKPLAQRFALTYRLPTERSAGTTTVTVKVKNGKDVDLYSAYHVYTPLMRSRH